MNKVVKVAVMAGLVGIVALATASAVFAQGGTPPSTWAPFGPGGMMGGNGYGRMGGYGYGFMTEYRDLMHQPVAEALGLSLDDFNTAIASGQTPWQLAQDKGVDAAALQAAMQAGHAAALKQAVADGKLTQEQADYMLAHQAQMQAWHAAGNYGPMLGGRGFRAGNGGAGYGPCHGGVAAATPAPAS